MIHLDDEHRAERKETVQHRLGAALGGYIPHNTYLVHCSASQARVLRDMQREGVVVWAGRVGAEHKYIPAHIDEHIRSVECMWRLFFMFLCISAYIMCWCM